MLHTASFYDLQDWAGLCYRVSRSHPRGKQAQWDTAPFLYPPRDLLNEYRQGALDFAGLAQKYRGFLDDEITNLAAFQEWVDALPSMGDVTLLCFERGQKSCHRRVAAEWLLERVPGLGRGRLL